MAIVVILLVLALIFGIGSVIEGLFWLTAIAVVMVLVAGLLGRNLLTRR